MNLTFSISLARVDLTEKFYRMDLVRTILQTNLRRKMMRKLKILIPTCVKSQKS